MKKAAYGGLWKGGGLIVCGVVSHRREILIALAG